MPRKRPSGNKLKRIFLAKDFSRFHFSDYNKPTDLFYADVASEIYTLIKPQIESIPGIDEARCRDISLRFAAFLEDLVSETGTWQAFISLCEKKYGTPLPMTDLSLPSSESDKLGMMNMFGGESDISNEDLRYFPLFPCVQFLLWYWLSYGRKTVLNPLNPALKILAEVLSDMLGEKYDEAPDTIGRPMFVPEETIGLPDYVQVRNMCEWLLKDNWLTSIIDYDEIEHEITEQIKTGFSFQGIFEDQAIYGSEAYMPFNVKCGPLGILPQEFLAEMVNLVHEDEEEYILPYIGKLESLPFAPYRFVEIADDRKTAVIEDLDGIHLDYSAYTSPGNIIASDAESGSALFSSLIRWGDEWCLNSVSLQGLSSEFYEEGKKQYEDKSANGRNSYDYLFKKMGKKRIRVAENYKEIAELLGIDRIPNRTDDKYSDSAKELENLVAFLCEDGNVLFYDGIAPCVKLRGNTTYDKDFASSEGFSLIMDREQYSEEFSRYLIEHNLVPDAAMNNYFNPKAGKTLFQANIRFMFDYTTIGTYRIFSDNMISGSPDSL